ncbi:MAG: hypothetical protein MUF15_14520 [Acidobacteria bacterium]|nr:hypothetical protein [Acidobacteriota bacterium]
MMNKQQIEERTCREVFVKDVMKNAGMTEKIGAIAGGFNILEVGGRDDLFELLKREFPGARVEQLKEGKLFEKKSFDYIAAAGLKYLPFGEETDLQFQEWLSYLKPHGLMSAHVCGYSGYYGAAMLGRIIYQLSPGKTAVQAGIIKIAQAVIRELPGNHPVFSSEIFKLPEEIAIKELLEFSSSIDHEDKLYTVSKLLDSVTRWNGCFLQWVCPSLYNPPEVCQSFATTIRRRLDSLPFIQRAISSELLTASPPGHYFIIKKKTH